MNIQLAVLMSPGINSAVLLLTCEARRVLCAQFSAERNEDDNACVRADCKHAEEMGLAVVI